MKFLFDKYPIDIVLCIFYSFIPILNASSHFTDSFVIIIGLPFILFIPGYIILFALFPNKKTNEGIDFIERIAISIGLSLAVVGLIGIGLNFAPGGIHVVNAFISIFILNLGFSAIAIYRWFKTSPEKRLIISFDFSITKSENKADKILNSFLIVLIILTAATIIYVVSTPKNLELSTEFYILGPSGKVENYSRNLSVGENASLVIGVINHEHSTIDYTIEIWLINQTNINNETTIANMWFMDKISISLDHVDVTGDWKPQWEFNYTFNINKKGENLKLTFLLFKSQTESYDNETDYKNISEQKINSAVGEIYIWINVN